MFPWARASLQPGERAPVAPPGGGRGPCYKEAVDGDLPDFIRTRQDLIDVHLSDNDIVEILTVLKEKAKLGSYEHIKILMELKYGKNPPPPSNERSLEDLLLESPIGYRPPEGAI